MTVDRVLSVDKTRVDFGQLAVGSKAEVRAPQHDISALFVVVGLVVCAVVRLKSLSKRSHGGGCVVVQYSMNINSF